jgi:hypothetical protein
MTGNKKRLVPSAILSSLSPSSFHIELKKSSLGAVAVVSGVMSVSNFTRECVELLSHSGRLTLIGDSLEISVLEGRVIEIFGRITEVRLGYGKA